MLITVYTALVAALRGVKPDIVTHDGAFHADDVFAVAAHAIKTGADVSDGRFIIIRTRDATCMQDTEAIVVDVGGVYAPLRRYDHHQRDFNETHPSGVKYSSFGLYWNDNAHSVVRRACLEYGIPVRDAQIAAIIARVTDTLVIPIDAVDNGAVSVTSVLRTDSAVRVPTYSISAMIHALNPVAIGRNTEDQFNDAFKIAVEIAIRILKAEIGAALAAVMSEIRVRVAIGSRERLPILVLDQFEAATMDVAPTDPHLLYVVFPDQKGTWMCQQVPVKKGAFDGRKPLPEAWAGLRDDDLIVATGVGDAVFCHAGRFICGAKSRDGAVMLAMKAAAA